MAFRLVLAVWKALGPLHMDLFTELASPEQEIQQVKVEASCLLSLDSEITDYPTLSIVLFWSQP